MEESCLISITGTQIVDGEEDTVELTTSGALLEINGIHYLKYREYDPDDHALNHMNVIKIEKDKNKIVHTKKINNHSTQLVLECGRRHQCVYSSPFGSMSIGIYTDSMVIELSETGGCIDAYYTIDFNADFQSENHLVISFHKKEE